MRIRDVALGMLVVGALGAGSVALASPAWAADPAVVEHPACRLGATIAIHVKKRDMRAVGSRSGCSDTVTYFWVRVYKVIAFYPDSEQTVQGRSYFQNGDVDFLANCNGAGQYYTHVSTATGLSGDSVESSRAEPC